MLLLDARLPIRHHTPITDLLTLNMARVLLEMRPDRIPRELYALAVVAPQDDRCRHPRQEFVELLVEELEAMDNSRGNLNLTVNDPDLWALFHALEKDDDRYREFRKKLGVDPEGVSRAVVLRALLRRGVADADGQLADEMREALATRAAEGF